MRSIEFEQGLFYNIKELMLRPGNAVKLYIKGKTKPYLNPITFFVIGFSFYGVANWLVYDVGLESESNPYLGTLIGFIFISAFMCYIPIVFTVCRRKYSLLESCLISFFLFGEISLLFTVITYSLTFLLVPGALAISGIISFTYFIWFQVSFYQRRLLRIIITTISAVVLPPLLLLLLEYVGLDNKRLQTAMGSAIPFEKEMLLDQTLNNIRNNLLIEEENILGMDAEYCTSGLAFTTYGVIDILKNEIVELTGGYLEDGLYVGMYGSDFIDNQTLSELNQKLEDYKMLLLNCGCDEDAEILLYFNSNDLVGMKMINALNLLTQLQIDILISHKNCDLRSPAISSNI